MVIESYLGLELLSNDIGLSDSLKNIIPNSDPPSKPGKPEVKDSDKKQITIEWEKPKKDGGAPIKGYNVERKDPRTGRWVKLNKVPITVSMTST